MRMLIVLWALLLSSTSAALAQNLPNYSVVGGDRFGTFFIPSSIVPNPPGDYLALSRVIPDPQGGTTIQSQLFLPLSSLATSASVNARIDQAFQQVAQAERGVAAVTAMANISMPSMPGRTTWAINGSIFGNEFGGGISLAHRLAAPVPFAITAAYGNGGGTAHIGRIGLMGEF